MEPLHFLKASVSSAGALLLTIPLPPRSLSAATRAAEASPSWCVYPTLHPDNSAELMSPVMEMGQFMCATGQGRYPSHRRGCGSSRGQPLGSDARPQGAANNLAITTIEGLASDPRHTHPVQQASLEIDVPQCGYCQSGQILSAVALLDRVPNPSDADIGAAMINICRCGTYVRIRQAVKTAALRS